MRGRGALCTALLSYQYDGVREKAMVGLDQEPVEQTQVGACRVVSKWMLVESQGEM